MTKTISITIDEETGSQKITGLDQFSLDELNEISELIKNGVWLGKTIEGNLNDQDGPPGSS
jgi:hypothetical protein